MLCSPEPSGAAVAPAYAAGSLQAWALSYITAPTLHEKVHPAIPETWSIDARPLRLTSPSRPEPLIVKKKSRVPWGELATVLQRTRLFHTFLHHELQAAELMAWAMLAFADAPRAFQSGLLTILRDEVAHMNLYEEYLASHGVHFGQYPVRDWFWTRVPQAQSPAQFCAIMGMGFEAANLDHATRFAERLRFAGDAVGAALQERIAQEELSHVRFAVHWYSRLAGPVEFQAWAHHLPAPLSPGVMRGQPIQHALREQAGLPAEFVRALEAFQWSPDARGY